MKIDRVLFEPKREDIIDIIKHLFYFKILIKERLMSLEYVNKLNLENTDFNQDKLNMELEELKEFKRIIKKSIYFLRSIITYLDTYEEYDIDKYLLGN
jgi:hypothetical protein